jgi:hypothetical protein
MFHIFGGQHEHRDNTNNTPDSSVNQVLYKKLHSRVPLVRRSLQRLLHQVKFNYFEIRSSDKSFE